MEQKKAPATQRAQAAAIAPMASDEPFGVHDELGQLFRPISWNDTPRHQIRSLH